MLVSLIAATLASESLDRRNGEDAVILASLVLLLASTSWPETTKNGRSLEAIEAWRN
jgi:hypothetical protein